MIKVKVYMLVRQVRPECTLWERVEEEYVYPRSKPEVNASRKRALNHAQKKLLGTASKYPDVQVYEWGAEIIEGKEKNDDS